MLEFHFELSKEDYYEYNKHHVYYAPANKRVMFRSRYMYPLIFVAFAALFAFGFPDIDPVFRGSLAIYSALFAVFRFVFFDALTDRRIKKMIARAAQDGKLYNEGPRSYCFEEKSFICTTETQTLKSAYSDLARVDIGKHAIYVYDGALKAHIFPNPVFADEEEKNRFVSFLQGKIDDGNEV